MGGSKSIKRMKERNWVDSLKVLSPDLGFKNTAVSSEKVPSLGAKPCMRLLPGSRLLQREMLYERHLLKQDLQSGEGGRHLRVLVNNVRAQ